MKRIFTLLALASAMVFAAVAREQAPVNLTPLRVAETPENLPTTFVTEAEGSMQRFAASGYVNTEYGLMDFRGLKFDLIVSDDGSKVSFSNIITLHAAQKEGTYVVGNITTNDAGKKVITIKANQLLQHYETLDEYLMAKTEMNTAQYAEAYGITQDEVVSKVGWTGPRYFYFVPAIENPLTANGMELLDELVLEENENGVFKTKHEQQVFLLSYFYGQEGYDFAAADLTLTPVTQSLCAVPEEGVEYRKYLHTIIDYYSSRDDVVCQVGFKDNKVYIPGLLFDGLREYRDMYLEGELGDDGVITILSPVFCNDETEEYRIIRAFGKKINVKLENDVYVIVANEEYEPIKLNYDPATGDISLAGNGWIADYPYGYENYSELKTHTYKCIDNVQYGNPANPTNLKYESSYFSFKVPFTDINGLEIPAAFLYYQLLIDTEDNIFEFTPDEFWLRNPTTELPINFDDIDIFHDGNGTVKIYWSKNREWEDLGVRTILNFDGEKKYSNIVWLKGTNALGDVATDLDNSDKPAYDVLGRNVDENYKGIVIQGGKLVIRR